MADQQNKPSTLVRKDIHTTLSDILDFGTDKITVANPQDNSQATHERLKKLVQQLKDLNQRIDRLTEA
jgi:hypothetical protein